MFSRRLAACFTHINTLEASFLQCLKSLQSLQSTSVYQLDTTVGNNSDVCLATNVRVLMSPPCISLPEGRPILFALPFQLLVTGGTQWNTVEQQDFHIASKGDWNEGHMKGMPQEGIRRNPILQHLLQLCPL